MTINYRGRHHEYRTNKHTLDTNTYVDCQPNHTNPRTFQAMVTHPGTINVETGEDENSILKQTMLYAANMIMARSAK